MNNTNLIATNQEESTAFVKALHQRINAYFKTNNISKKGNRMMFTKVYFAAIWWLSSCVLLFIGDYNMWQFAGLYLFHCMAQLYILLNIAHDANHHSISKNKKVNQFLSYSFDLCGVNSYMWRSLHHDQHHYCVNVHDEDETMIARHLFRFTEETKIKFIHQFQHLYFFFFYGLFIVDWILTKDFECFFLPHTNHLKEVKHPRKEYVKLFIGKILYIGYMIAIPIFVLGFSPVFVIAIFFVCHFLVGVVGGVIVQIAHPIANASFPKSTNEYDNFIYHVFATTADFSYKSQFARWFWGGLHLHVIHHIAPGICHTHYPPLTKIVKETAKEYGVEYRESKTIWGAIYKHYLLLKKMGQQDYYATRRSTEKAF